MDTRTALLLTPQGQCVPITLPTNSIGQLAVMYAVIRCTTVDAVDLTSQLTMWVDGDGLYRQPVNPAATLLATHHGRTQPYHGPVLLTGGADDEGDTLPLSADQVDALLLAFNSLAR